MRSLLCLLVLCLVAVNAQLVINFERNVTGSKTNSDWSFRKTAIASWDLSPLIGTGVYYSSVSLGGTKNSVNGDALWGSSYVVTGGFPVSWLAFWDATVNFGAGTDWTKVDVDAAAGFIANSYVALLEKDPQGNIVGGSSLQQQLFGLSYDLVEEGSNVNGLKWISFKGSSSQNPWTITITYVLSDVVGVIDYGDAIVGPKSLESIISIENWQYKNKDNTLSLVIGVASGDISTEGNLIISNPNTDNQVYFRAATEAKIDGTSKSVTVKYDSTTNYTQFFGDANILTQLQGVTKGSYTLKVATVTFPAGSNKIVYDPTVGAGEPVKNNSSSSVACSIATILFSIVCVLVSM